MEMLWKDLKQAVHGRKPTNVTELKLFCMEEWAKIPLSRTKQHLPEMCCFLLGLGVSKGTFVFGSCREKEQG